VLAPATLAFVAVYPRDARSHVFYVADPSAPLSVVAFRVTSRAATKAKLSDR
jgi:hypothetical protein